MLGAIIGDIVGSRFEFNNYRNTDFELFHKDCTFTDDTICTMAVADWLMKSDGRGLAEIMRQWCQRYPNPAGGYGYNFKQWVKGYIKGPYNSFGNGSAMRVSPVGWSYSQTDQIMHVAKQTAIITHDHPEGINGAQCIAIAIYLLRIGTPKHIVKREAENTFGYNLDMICNDIRSTNTFNETCQVTVPQAIVCFLESTDFESAIRLAVSIGGDSDTIAAITGSLAEAAYGIPEWMKDRAVEYLPKEMIDIINLVYTNE